MLTRAEECKNTLNCDGCFSKCPCRECLIKSMCEPVCKDFLKFMTDTAVFPREELKKWERKI